MRLPPEGERSTGDSDHSECSRGNSEDPVEGKKERRKQQNRVAQRNYRIKKQARLSELERKFAEVQSGQTGSSINATTADVPAVKAADLTAAERDVLLNQISHLEQENASLQAHVNSCYFMQPPYALPYDPYQYQYQYPQYPTPFFPAVQPMQLFSQPTPFHPQSFTQTHSFSAVALLPAQNKQLPPVTHPVAALPALPQPQLPSIAAKDPQSRAPPLNPMRSDLKLIPGLSSKTHLVDAFCNTIERLFLVGTNSEKKSLTFRIQQMQNEIVDSAASPVDRLKALEVIDASRKKHAHYGRPVLEELARDDEPTDTPSAAYALLNLQSHSVLTEEIQEILNQIRRIPSLESRADEMNELVQSFKVMQVKLRDGHGPSPVEEMAKQGTLLNRLLDACLHDQDRILLLSLYDEARRRMQ